ncbi:hypothetical protein pb186bvf_019986 [Paramecium bursaria]
MEDRQWLLLTNKIIYRQQIGCLQLQNVIQTKIQNFRIYKIQRLFVIDRLYDNRILLGGRSADSFMTFWLDEDKIILKRLNKYFVTNVCLLEENFFLKHIGISHILGNYRLYITFYQQKLLKKRKSVKFEALPSQIQMNLLEQDSHKVYTQFFRFIEFDNFVMNILINFEINKKLGLIMIRNFQINQFQIQIFIRMKELCQNQDTSLIKHKLVYFVDLTNDINGFFILGNKMNLVSLTNYKQQIIVLVNVGQCYEVYQYTNSHKLSKLLFKTNNMNCKIYKEHPFVVQNLLFLNSMLTEAYQKIDLKIEN